MRRGDEQRPGRDGCRQARGARRRRPRASSERQRGRATVPTRSPVPAGSNVASGGRRSRVPRAPARHTRPAPRHDGPTCQDPRLQVCPRHDTLDVPCAKRYLTSRNWYTKTVDQRPAMMLHRIRHIGLALIIPVSALSAQTPARPRRRVRQKRGHGPHARRREAPHAHLHAEEPDREPPHHPHPHALRHRRRRRIVRQLVRRDWRRRATSSSSRTSADDSRPKGSS